MDACPSSYLPYYTVFPQKKAETRAFYGVFAHFIVQNAQTYRKTKKNTGQRPNDECNDMTKYLIKRILHGAVSIVIVVAIVMILIYTCMNRQQIFAQDNYWTKVKNNQRTVYEFRKWNEYGYVDLIMYSDWLVSLTRSGEIDEATRSSAVAIGKTPSADSETAKQYVKKFTDFYQSQGYTVRRLNAVMMTTTKLADGGTQYLFAYRDKPLITRLWKYFTGLIRIDNIHNVKEDIGKRELIFTMHDPVYGGEKFSPAIMGNGTDHKYLLYFDDSFPYIHQNLVTINLGKSYAVNAGIDVAETMSVSQGRQTKKLATYPSGLTEETADNLHTAKYSAGSKDKLELTSNLFTDDYTNVSLFRSGKSMVGYSFIIGIIAAALAYLLGVPIGVIMARHKDKLVDKIGTVYIIFIIAVPSLAYIFLFKAIGGKLGLPTTFNMEVNEAAYYILPIVSLALPSIANLMKWLRRYMIDQMNSDYVKFARSGGLSEGEIFRKHILKNAAIPLIHGIPGSVLGALVGAIITERVYVVPGAGNLLTMAINARDNGVIVGVTLFYASLSVISIILGDILMSMVDPRISFSSKAR